MGGTTKWPYNDSDCLDADQFKLVADKLVTDAGVTSPPAPVRPMLTSLAIAPVLPAFDFDLATS